MSNYPIADRAIELKEKEGYHLWISTPRDVFCSDCGCDPHDESLPHHEWMHRYIGNTEYYVGWSQDSPPEFEGNDTDSYDKLEEWKSKFYNHRLRVEEFDYIATYIMKSSNLPYTVENGTYVEHSGWKEEINPTIKES